MKTVTCDACCEIIPDIRPDGKMLFVSFVVSDYSSENGQVQVELNICPTCWGRVIGLLAQATPSPMRLGWPVGTDSTPPKNEFVALKNLMEEVMAERERYQS